MSRIRADRYTNRAGTGAPTFADGVNVVGITSVKAGAGVTTLEVTGDLSVISGTIKGASELSISGITSSISDTAVDIFVYDTSKDSDGGAWRKRTQNTSWYNETLNTATRGSRREFPAVAVIVAEATKVTIYDGDDPDLPMWMEFNTTSGNLIGGGTLRGVTALNGVMVTPASAYAMETRFISDYSIDWFQNQLFEYKGNIEQRNDTLGFRLIESYGIVSSTCNDAAMTVLPNAPIDDTTGLPIPTIAIATDGGVSVIKDDGNVVDITSASGGNYNQSKVITITEENYLWWLGDYNAGSTYLRDSYAVSLDNFPSSDFTWNNTNDNVSAGTYYALTTNGEAGEIRIGPGNTWAWNHQERNALGGPAGLAIHKPNIGSETNSLIAAITSDYNTGWMHGSCEGAFLSDTDTTNVSATNLNLITNGDFSNGTTGWSNDATPTFTVSGGGVASVGRNGGGATGQCYQTITTEVGRTYTVGVLVSAVSNGFQVYAGESPSSSNITMSQGAVNTTGTHYFTFTATTTSTRLDFSATQDVSGTASFDNITIFDGVADRSVNNKGLAVYGTITKSAVATGADLVAYSGFSASNYLVQPNNSDLAPGTDPYSVTCWIKTSTSGSNDQYIFDRGTSGTASRNLILVMQTSGRIQFYNTNSSGTASDLQTTDMPSVADDIWHQIVCLYDGSAYRAYIDGRASSVTNTTGRDVGNDGNPELTIGTRFNYTQTFGGDLALFRYSRTAPSPEQIKKIYEDEKVLFQENAKATLYGSSDAVTALAYDDTTELLHVGTSGGRSEFQGLRRINNTTTAVTTAISASNELVAEQ